LKISERLKNVKEDIKRDRFVDIEYEIFNEYKDEEEKDK